MAQVSSKLDSICATFFFINFFLRKITYFNEFMVWLRKSLKFHLNCAFCNSILKSCSRLCQSFHFLFESSAILIKNFVIVEALRNGWRHIFNSPTLVSAASTYSIAEDNLIIRDYTTNLYEFIFELKKFMACQIVEVTKTVWAITVLRSFITTLLGC